MSEGGTVNVKIQLEPSEEREAIAKFVEYAFDICLPYDRIVDAVRSGEYLEILIQKNIADKSREGNHG